VERSRHSGGCAIATKLLTSANSRLWRSGALPVGLSLGLWSLWTMRMRCLRRLGSSTRLCCPSLPALLASVVKR